MENDILELSEKYEPLFEWLEADKDNPLFTVNTVVITGGRYSQKSFGVGTFSGVAAKDYNHRILYTRYTLTSAEDSIIPEFVEKLEVLNCENQFEVKKDRIVGINNNSKVVFKGIKTSSGNQTASLKSLKDFSIFILEEAEEMPNFTDWDKIKKSIRALDVRNLSILLLNPTTKEHWIYKELFEEKGVPEGFNGIVGNTLYIHSTYLDVERKFITDDIWTEYEEMRLIYEEYENLSFEQKQSYDQKKKRKAFYYKHTILGGWLDKAEGVIYTNWKLGKFEEVSVPVYGQDFGFSVDPTTLVKVCIDKAQKKIFAKECFYKPKLTTSEIAALNKHHAGQSLIYADSAEPRLIEELKTYELNIKGTEKGAGSITAGIAAIQDYELIIDPESVNLIKELNNYAWSDKKSGTPIDAHNHCFVGETLITTDKGLKQLEDISIGDMVLTSKGYKPVKKLFVNGYDKILHVKLKLRTLEVELRGTYTHKIKTTKGWKQLGELTSGDTIYLHKSLTENTTTCIKGKDIFHVEEKGCTLQFGNTTTGVCQKDITFITRIKTGIITLLKTLNWFPLKNTLKNITKKIYHGLNLKNTLSILPKSEKKQKNGMQVKRAESGTQNTGLSLWEKPLSKESALVSNAEINSPLSQATKKTDFAQISVSQNGEGIQELTMSKENARNAEQNLQQTNIPKLNIVESTISQVEVVSQYNDFVYDLHVDECHEYFANAVLVHNCLDSLRYAVYPTLKPQKEVFFF